MIEHCLLRQRALLLLALSALAVTTTAMASVPPATPLAVVGNDTVKVDDLNIELATMRQGAPDRAQITLPPPAKILQRLIENRLLVQEGYRMGLNDQFTVKNQVSEYTITRAVNALVDSVVAASPPAETSGPREARRLAVRAYIDGLEKRYDVKVDEKLLASLDYGSTDTTVQHQLHDSEAVLVQMPDGKLRVKHLSREIRFQEFHGIAGKPDAAQRRDEVFGKMLDEAMLRYEARRAGLAERPQIQADARHLEQRLMLEESLKILGQIDFKPTDAQVQAFYQAHLDAVTPMPRVKLQSLKLTSKEAAQNVHDRLLQGTMFSWLRKNAPGVVDGSPPFPEDFFTPDMLGLKPEQMRAGVVLDPFEAPGGWIVAVVAEVEKVQPEPLTACHDKILNMMRTEQTITQVRDVITRLRAATPIRVLPGAEATVAEGVAAFGIGS